VFSFQISQVYPHEAPKVKCKTKVSCCYRTRLRSLEGALAFCSLLFAGCVATTICMYAVLHNSRSSQVRGICGLDLLPVSSSGGNASAGLSPKHRFGGQCVFEHSSGGLEPCA
jgi:hypothetical protein